jgi:peptidoglycan/LPS O-acetylase OafA/YrhL
VIYNLQLLRAFAAISVVYLHVVSDAGLNLGFGFGNYGVDLFFVISGFTMSYVGHISAGHFFLRRCIRILPLYWLATLGTFSIARSAPNLLQSASGSISSLLHSLAFIPYANKLGNLQPTLALGWTLNYEMYFYLLFTVSLVFTLRFAPVATTILLVFVAAAVRFAGTHNKILLYYADPIVYEFCFGVVVYYLAAAFCALKMDSSNLAVARTGILISAGVAAIALPLQERFVQGDRTVCAGLPAAVLVLTAVILERHYRFAATSNWVVLLGDSSYVLYLIHPFVVYGVIRLFMNPLTMSFPALVAAIIGLMGAAILAAIGVHVVVERPILAYLRERIAAKKPSPVPLTI